MSHISTVQVQIKNLRALATAARKMGCEFMRDQKTFKMWGGWQGKTKPVSCDHAIALKNAPRDAYEVGVIRNGKGWELQLDNFDSKLTDRVGRDCAKLTQEYAVAMVEQEAAELVAQGWVLDRVDLPNGDVQITLNDGQ